MDIGQFCIGPHRSRTVTMHTGTRTKILIRALTLIMWIPSSVGQNSQITSTSLYMRSIGQLCGWANCRGWCEYQDRVRSIGDLDGTACRAAIYSRAVRDVYDCDSKVCVTFNIGGGQLCRADADTQTACYHLYRNASTKRVQTRVCLDPDLGCMDLVNFCRIQSSLVCNAYKSNPATIAPAVSQTVYRVSSIPRDNSTWQPPVSAGNMSTKSSTDTTTSAGKTDEFVDAGFPFLAGIVIGFGAAAVPIIILVVALLCVKKRLKRRSINVGGKKNTGIELGETPVYASIGPELPTRGPTLHNHPGASPAAKSLYISGRRPTNLLGNRHRNKSLPELVFESGSVPMESNDMLRAFATPERLSSSTDGFQSPSSKKSPGTPVFSPGLHSPASPRYDSFQLSRSTGDIIAPSRTTPTSSKLPPELYDQPFRKQDAARKFSPRLSGQGISNKLYADAIIPGRPSYYPDDEDKDAYQKVETDLLDGRQRLEQRFHGPHRKRPSLENIADPSGLVSEGDVGMGELNKSAKLPAYSPLIQTRKGFDANDARYASPGTEPPTRGLSRPVHMGLTSDSQATRAQNRPQPDRGYMGLDNSGLSPKNQYMGIGGGVMGSPGTPESPSGEVTPVSVGKGAYTELNLLEASTSKPNEYMGLTPEEERRDIGRQTPGGSTSSYVDLDKNFVKEKSAQEPRKKYWKSKSTYQKRNTPTDNQNGNPGEPQEKQKKKKSSLFRGKKRDRKTRGAAGAADGVMCLDLNISTSPPPTGDTKPHYFTLESGSRRPPDWNGVNGVSTSEYQGPDQGDISPMEEPFRSRSKSQPVRQTFESTEEYEMIKESWRPTIFPKPEVTEL